MGKFWRTDLDILLELAINNQIITNNGFTPLTFKEAERLVSKAGRRKKDAPDLTELKAQLEEIKNQFVCYPIVQYSGRNTQITVNR